MPNESTVDVTLKLRVTLPTESDIQEMKIKEFKEALAYQVYRHVSTTKSDELAKSIREYNII